MMDATTDKDPLVQEQIYNALCYLGESEPEEILNSCDEYLRQHDKVRLCSARCWERQQEEKYFLVASGTLAVSASEGDTGEGLGYESGGSAG